MIFRKWVTETSFLCDPKYLSLPPKRQGYRTRSVRRACGFVLTAHPEVIIQHPWS